MGSIRCATNGHATCLSRKMFAFFCAAGAASAAASAAIRFQLHDHNLAGVPLYFCSDDFYSFFCSFQTNIFHLFNLVFFLLLLLVFCFPAGHHTNGPVYKIFVHTWFLRIKRNK